VPLPRHVGDLWQIVQEIACEEDPSIAERSVVEHWQSGAEAMRDVERWLEIYRRRLNPEHRWRFPEHHARHRGCCLVLRNWPHGPRWEAFDEETLRKLPVGSHVTRADLEASVDAYLDAQAR
jgi:hypothetical protein